MQLVEQYTKWFLPQLLKVDTWKELITEICNEVVQLQISNMGSTDSEGLNGLPESITFDSNWLIGTNYDKATGLMSGVNTLSIVDGELIYSADTLTNIAILQYAFVLGRSYTVTVDVTITDSAECSIRIGSLTQVLTNGLNTITLACDDYYMGFEFSGSGSVHLGNIAVVGELLTYSIDDRRTVLSRLMNIENASTEILTRLRDSLDLPKIPNLDDTLLKNMIILSRDLNANAGTETANAILMYMLGYGIELRYLYARKGDYEQNTYSFIPQKVSDTLVSGATIYGKVASTYLGTNITLLEGHNVIQGDKIFNQTNNWTNGTVNVIEVVGNVVTVDEIVQVTEDDLIDIQRTYTYPVNPDSDNYFKTSHIDVLFSSQFNISSDLTFIQLQEILEQYLPANVVIRFFGYKEPNYDEQFKLKETTFRTSIGAQGEEQTLTLVENIEYPESTEILLVWNNETDINGEDINGVPVDIYSYVYYVDELSGENVYLAIPIE